MQQLAGQLSNKLDRDEIEKIQRKLENQQISTEEAREQQEAIFGKVRTWEEVGDTTWGEHNVVLVALVNIESNPACRLCCCHTHTQTHTDTHLLTSVRICCVQYGISLEEAAAGMRRPMEPYACISCNRPIRPGSQQPMPCACLLVSKSVTESQALRVFMCARACMCLCVVVSLCVVHVCVCVMEGRHTETKTKSQHTPNQP